jgi:hypothetical protein
MCGVCDVSMVYIGGVCICYGMLCCICMVCVFVCLYMWCICSVCVRVPWYVVVYVCVYVSVCVVCV